MTTPKEQLADVYDVEYKLPGCDWRRWFCGPTPRIQQCHEAIQGRGYLHDGTITMPVLNQLPIDTEFRILRYKRELVEEIGL